MSWLNWFRPKGASPPHGICLDADQPHWELQGPAGFLGLFTALPDLLPPDSVLYFEGPAPQGAWLQFFGDRAEPPRACVAPASTDPPPAFFHVPGNRANIDALVELARTSPADQWPQHFHVHCRGRIVLEWIDAPHTPILISGGIPQPKVARLARALSMTCQGWRNARQKHVPRKGLLSRDS